MTKAKITFVTDVDAKASASLAKAYSAEDMGKEYFPNKKNIPLPDLVYIASNHSTHTQYALEYMEYGCDIFIEKPISINFTELENLSKRQRFLVAVYTLVIIGLFHPQ